SIILPPRNQFEVRRCERESQDPLVVSSRCLTHTDGSARETSANPEAHAATARYSDPVGNDFSIRERSIFVRRTELHYGLVVSVISHAAVPVDLRSGFAACAGSGQRDEYRAEDQRTKRRNARVHGGNIASF